MEQLEKMYEALKVLQELGLNVSQEQLNAVKDKEREYLDDEVIPRLKEMLEPLIAKMISKFEFSLTYDPNNGLQIVKINKTAPMPNLFGTSPRSKTNPRFLIRVVYPDGHVDCNKRVSHTFLNVVNYAGPERVRALNIYCMGDNLVSDKKMTDERYVKAQYETNVEGLYLMTLSSTEKKLEYMQQISRELNLGLIFEKVERN